MTRRLIPALAALLLAGCSTTGSWFSGLIGGEDNTPPPTPLTDIDEPVPLKKLWSTGFGDGFDTQAINLVPAVYGGRVFVADRKGRVAAMDLETGERLWEVKTDELVSAGPGVGEGYVVLGTSSGDILALDDSDGSLLWTVEAGSEVLAVPQVDVGKIIVQTVDGTITAFDAEDGARLWVYQRTVPVLTLRGTSTPAVKHGAVIAGFANGKLVAISAEQGFVAWETSIALPRGRSELERMVDVDSSPVVVGGAVYVTSYQGKVAVIDIQNGNVGWKRDMSSHNGLGVDFSQVYVTDDQSNLWALARSSGASEWRLDKLANRGLTGPEPFEEYVAVGDAEGYLHLVSRYDGSLVSRVLVDKAGIRARPRSVGDRLVVYGNGGNLAVYTLTGG